MPDQADDRPEAGVEGAAADAGAGAEPGKRQSVAGIVSCCLFGLVLVLVVVFRIVKPGEGVSGPAMSTVRLLRLIAVRVSFYAVLLGMVFALLGLLQRERRRHLAVAGLVLNGLPFVLVLVDIVRRVAGL